MENTALSSMILYLAAALAVVAGCGILATVLAFVIFGPRTIKQYGNDLTWVPCTGCSAGVQWWDGQDWVPFPDHVKMMRTGGTHIEAPQANIRNHPDCGGRGGWWK